MVTYLSPKQGDLGSSPNTPVINYQEVDIMDIMEYPQEIIDACLELVD